MHIPMKRTTILLDDELLLEVKHMAQLKGMTATNVIKEAVRAYVGEKPNRSLPSFTGIGKAGRRLAENSEKILRKAALRRKEW
ncbi:MAG: DNA-binding protein [Acidobacteria bacterium]|nr:MAG: DNA-binding protein [Acidobacteriota bacterium]PYS08332.1 MAG: DNA-binding protein [Acidobacteriota bacterium]